MYTGNNAVMTNRYTVKLKIRFNCNLWKWNSFAR